MCELVHCVRSVAGGDRKVKGATPTSAQPVRTGSPEDAPSPLLFGVGGAVFVAALAIVAALGAVAVSDDATVLSWAHAVRDGLAPLRAVAGLEDAGAIGS